MGIDLEKVKQRLKEWEESGEADKWVKKYAEQQDAKDRRSLKLNSLDDEAFERFMQKVFVDNGEEWKEKCFYNGCEPYPTNLMYLAIDTARLYGEDVSQASADAGASFPEQVNFYRGYYFSTIYGQGASSSIMTEEQWQEWLSYLRKTK
jgi:hypothetical protein